ncbi:hypothetical protein F4779DRAFT_634179 [Xylariaceae sp. FL0662B]|nr:hypothetical protein F4779DRAFT_634179 [Xylariaceae sp. FL0662B]
MEHHGDWEAVQYYSDVTGVNAQVPETNIAASRPTERREPTRRTKVDELRSRFLYQSVRLKSKPGHKSLAPAAGPQPLTVECGGCTDYFRSSCPLEVNAATPRSQSRPGTWVAGIYSISNELVSRSLGYVRPGFRGRGRRRIREAGSEPLVRQSSWTLNIERLVRVTEVRDPAVDGPGNAAEEKETGVLLRPGGRKGARLGRMFR